MTSPEQEEKIRTASTDAPASCASAGASNPCMMLALFGTPPLVLL